MRHHRRRRRRRHGGGGGGGGGGGVGKTALEAQCRWCRSPRPMQSPTARTENETPRRQRSSRAVCWFAWSTRRAHAVRSAHTLMAFSRCSERASEQERAMYASERAAETVTENTQCATRSSMYESDAARGREGDEASRRGAAGAAAAGGGARRARERLSARLRETAWWWCRAPALLGPIESSVAAGCYGVRASHRRNYGRLAVTGSVVGCSAAHRLYEMV